MPRISMVPFDSLVRIYSNTHHKNDLEAMNHLESAYEQGMIEVLMEIASLKLLQYEKSVDNSYYQNTKEKIVSNNSISNALELCNTKEQKDAILDIESELNHNAVIESKKHFIDGFIFGYKFLKEIR